MDWRHSHNQSLLIQQLSDTQKEESNKCAQQEVPVDYGCSPLDCPIKLNLQCVLYSSVTLGCITPLGYGNGQSIPVNLILDRIAFLLQTNVCNPLVYEPYRALDPALPVTPEIAEITYSLQKVVLDISAGGGAPAGPASGDLSGNYPGPTVKWANGYTTYDTVYINVGEAAAGDLTGTYPAPLVKWENGYTIYDGRYLQESTLPPYIAYVDFPNVFTESQTINVTLSQSTGTEYGLALNGTINQSGDATYTLFKVNQTISTLGAYTVAPNMAEFNAIGAGSVAIGFQGAMSMSGVIAGTDASVAISGFQTLNTFSPVATTVTSLYAGTRTFSKIDNSSSNITSAYGYYSRVDLGAGFTGTVTDLSVYFASNSVITGGTITNWYGFRCSGNGSATSNYAFFSSMSATVGRWNLYMTGSAANYLNGVLQVGSATASAGKVQILSTTEQLRLLYDASNYTSFTVGSTGILTITPAGTGTLAVAVNSAFYTSATPGNANLWVTSNASYNRTGLAEYLFSAAPAIALRVGFRGINSSPMTIGDSYCSFVIGTQVATTAASGTHALLAQQVIKPLTITAGGATVTNTATLYIENAATGATNNYALWVAAGSARFGGTIVDSANASGNSGDVLTATGTGILWQPISAGGGAVTGGGVSGQVAYWNSALGITGNANLFWDNTNTRLGIGTATPATKLHIIAGVAEAIRLSNDGSNYATISVGATGGLILATVGGGSISTSNVLVAAGSFYTNGTNTNANLWIGSGIGATASTLANYLFAGATAISMRIGMRGSTTASPAAGSSFANLVMAQQSVNVFTSGTHALFAGMVIKPLSITTAAGVLTNSASLYVEAAATGAVNNYSVWVAAGTTRLDGQLQNPGISGWEYNIFAALGSSIKAGSMSIEKMIATFALQNQNVKWQALWIPSNSTITGMKWYQAVAGNYTAVNYNGVALYSYAAGTLTLVASSTDDPAIWQTASNTWGTKAFTTPYNAVAGCYFIAFLYNRSAEVTAPTVGAQTPWTNGAVAGIDFTNSAKITAFIAGLIALPATQAMSATSPSAQPMMGMLY